MAIEGFTPYRKEEAEEYDRNRWWLGMTWGMLFDKATDVYPWKEALTDGVNRDTYRQLREKVDKLAIALINLGIKPAERVMVQAPNWSEFIYAFYAVQKIAAIPVLLIPRQSHNEIIHMCNITDPIAWIIPERHGRTDYLPLIESVQTEYKKLRNIITVRAESDKYTKLERLIEDTELNEENLRKLRERRADPNEVAQILPTGGTTGMPKAVARAHNPYLCNVEYHVRALEITSDDVVMTIAPMSHAQGLLCGIGHSMFAMAKFVLCDSTKPDDMCRMIQEEKVTSIGTVPTLVDRIVNYEKIGDYDLSSLKHIMAGGAMSTPDLIEKVYARLGCRYVNEFGSSEGTHCSTRANDDLDTILHKVGKPCCPYDRYKVINPATGKDLGLNVEGELVAKGPSVFTGYFRSPEINEEIFTGDGFFRTGDLAKIDEGGYITITGRIKDIIIRGGENLSAPEMEELIKSHEKVRDAAVVGMPDRLLGERACAYIVPEAGWEPTLEEIVAYLKNRGASVLQLPERVEKIRELPLTGVGKVDKKALREDIKAKVEAG